MKVKDLIEKLQKCNPDAPVMVLEAGYLTEAGTWLEGDPVEVQCLSPSEEFRSEADEIFLS